MKKLSEMKYQKLNLTKIKNDLNLIIEEFNSASNFEEQDKAFKNIISIWIIYPQILLLLQLDIIKIH